MQQKLRRLSRLAQENQVDQMLQVCKPWYFYAHWVNRPMIASSIICYCIASILMTVINKVGFRIKLLDLILDNEEQFVVSGRNFSMNFLLLCIQSSFCVACVSLVKILGIISFRDFDKKDAKMWFPISFLLVSVIYTGSKSLVSSNVNPEWCWHGR